MKKQRKHYTAEEKVAIPRHKRNSSRGQRPSVILKKMFIDSAGATIPVYDRHTGLPWQSALFVAALGEKKQFYG